MSVSRQRTSLEANAAAAIASGPATARPSGRTAIPKSTSPPRTNSGPRTDQRPMLSLFTECSISSTPRPPSSTARPLGRVPGPMPPAAVVGKSRACQNANAATAITARPPRKSCRRSFARMSAILLKECPPVLIHVNSRHRGPGHHAAMVKHILLPTDGSRVSGKGAAAGVRLAKALGAKVTGVYVAAPYYRPPMYLEGGVYIPGVSPEAYRKLSEAQAKKALAPVAAAARKAHVRCATRMVTARRPSDGILKAARALGCD